MGQKHWSEEEKDCLLHYIIPHSVYAKGYLDAKNGGMGFTDLAKIMQAKMRAEGVENRVYTDPILFQKYYQTMSRMGKKGVTGPTGVMLSKQKLEKIKEFRAWLNQNDGNNEDEVEVEEDGVPDLNNSPPQHHQLPQSRPPQHFQNSQDSHDQEAEMPAKKKERTSFFHPVEQLSPGGTMRRVYDDENILPPPNPRHRSLCGAGPPRAHQPNQYHPELERPHAYPHVPQPQPQPQHPRNSAELAAYRAGGYGDQPDETGRTSHFHPYPQLSPGGTMRRIYDDERVCPPETPNFLSVYGKRKATKFILPYYPEDNCFTHAIKKRKEKKAAEYAADQADRADRAHGEDGFGDFEDSNEYDDNDDDDFPPPPAKRHKSSPFKANPNTPVKKTPTTPATERPSASKTKPVTPANRRAPSPAEDDDEEDVTIQKDDDENDESSEEDVDPNLVGYGGDSPVGIPRFDVQEAATRPLTVPKQYNVGMSSLTFASQGVDMRSLPRLQGGFIDPEDNISEDEDDEDVRGGDDSATA